VQALSFNIVSNAPTYLYIAQNCLNIMRTAFGAYHKMVNRCSWAGSGTQTDPNSQSDRLSTTPCGRKRDESCRYQSAYPIGQKTVFLGTLAVADRGKPRKTPALHEARRAQITKGIE
jgi:hypothetical protein